MTGSSRPPRWTARAPTPSCSTPARRAAVPRRPRRRSRRCCSSTAPPGARSSASRAGTRSCSGAGGGGRTAARGRDRRSRSCPASPPAWRHPAYAGIPVTHRDAASAVAFVTGHEDPAKPESALDWAALARFPGTLVVYMGVRRLEAIAARADGGRTPGAEPAAVIQRGTLPDQRVVTGHARDDRRRRPRAPGSRPPPSRCSGRWRRCAPSWPGSSRGRWAAGPSRSPGRGPRPAGWRRGCATSAPP